VAAALFLSAVVVFGYVLKTGSITVDSALSLNQAVFTVQSKMEEIRTLPFDQLALLDGSLFEKGAGKIIATPVLADLIKIQLELKWDPKKIPLRLYTLRSKY
jgi:hypothetical protein